MKDDKRRWGLGLVMGSGWGACVYWAADSFLFEPQMNADERRWGELDSPLIVCTCMQGRESYLCTLPTDPQRWKKFRVKSPDWNWG